MFLRHIKLYLQYIKQSFKTTLEYRGDFIIGITAWTLSQIANLLFIWVLFENVKSINGWTLYEITLIYGLLSLSASINYIFFGNLWILGSKFIRLGEFDLFLLKPLSPLFQLVSSKFDFEEFGNVIFEIVLISISINKLNISIGLNGILMIILFAVSGGAIYAAIHLIVTTTSFWIIRSNEIVWAVNSMGQFAQYPITIYNKFIRIVITWIIPYAFASFYPANYFLHKRYENLSLLSPIIAVVLWIIALRVWNFGLRHYESTGS